MGYMPETDYTDYADVIENTLGVLHNTSNKSEHTPRGSIHIRSYDVTSCDLTSNPVAILLPVMRNDTFYTNTIVRKKRGENDVTSCAVTSGHVTSVHVTSISHATSGHGQLYISYYCYGKKKSARMCRTYFRLWRHFPSRNFMWRHFWLGSLPVTSLPLPHTQWPAPPEIFLELSRYTTLTFGFGGTL